MAKFSMPFRVFLATGISVVSMSAASAQQYNMRPSDVQQAAVQASERNVNSSSPNASDVVTPISLTSEQIVALQAQWKSGKNQFTIIDEQNLAPAVTTFGASSQMRTPETPRFALPSVDSPVVGDDSPVVALHNRDDRRTNDRDYSYDKRDRRYRRNNSTIVLCPGQQYVDPSGRVIILGNNNTIIINQAGYGSYPYDGYGSPYGYGNPYGYGYGYPVQTYGGGVTPIYGYGFSNSGSSPAGFGVTTYSTYPTYGYPANYGSGYGYSTDYGYGNAYGNSYGNGNSYDNSYNFSVNSNGVTIGGSYQSRPNGSYSTRTSASGWLQGPGTISSVQTPALPFDYNVTNPTNVQSPHFYSAAPPTSTRVSRR